MKLDQLEEVQVRQDCCMVVDRGCCGEYEMEMRRLCLLDYFNLPAGCKTAVEGFNGQASASVLCNALGNACVGCVGL